MNKVIVTGNISSIYENSGNTKVTIADNYKDKTTFIPCTVFAESTRKFIKNYMRTGDHIVIEGRIGSYKDNNGKETISIIAESVNFEGYKNPAKQAREIAKDNFVIINDSELTEDDLPWNTEEQNNSESTEEQNNNESTEEQNNNTDNLPVWL